MTMLPPTIIRTTTTLTIGDWCVPLPPTAPFGTRVGQAAVTLDGDPITVWRAFRPTAQGEEEVGILLEYPNGYGLMVFIREGAAVQHARIGYWLSIDALHGTGNTSAWVEAPPEILSRLSWLARDPETYVASLREAEGVIA